VNISDFRKKVESPICRYDRENDLIAMALHLAALLTYRSENSSSLLLNVRPRSSRESFSMYHSMGMHNASPLNTARWGWGAAQGSY
jgi:hypothetical protein